MKINNRKKRYSWFLDAQEDFQQNENKEVYVKSFERLARYLELSEDQALRKEYIDKSISEGRRLLGESHSILAEAYQQRGELFFENKQIDSCYYNLDLAISIFEQVKDYENLCWCLITKSVYQYYSNDLKEMKTPLDQALDVVSQHPGLDPEISNFIFQMQAILHREMGAYDEALKSAKKAVELTLSIPKLSHRDSLDLADRYNNLGIIFADRKDFVQAIQNYRIALFLRNNAGASPSVRIQNFNNIGKNLRDAGKFEEAWEAFQESYAILENNSTACTHTDSIEVAIFLAMVALEKGDAPKSKAYLEQIAPLVKRTNYYEHWYYFNLAEIYFNTEDYVSALPIYAKAHELLEEDYGKGTKAYIQSLTRMAEAYSGNKEYTKALEHIQRALSEISPSFIGEDHFSNPKLENISTLSLLLSSLSTKIIVLKKVYEGDPANLEKILPTCRLAAATIDKIRQTQHWEASKLILNKLAQPVYSQTLDLYYQLYQATHQPQYLEEAFQFMEKSKSLVLLEGIREYKAQQSNLEGLAASDTLFLRLLEEEKQLKLDRVFYERKLAEARLASDSLKMETLETSLVVIYERLQNLQQRFQTEFPVYHQANYDLSVATIQQVQEELLRGNTARAIIEYHLGEYGIFVMRITAESADFFRLDYPDSFDALLTDYRQALTGKNPAADYPQYIAAAHQLFQALLAPVLDGLPSTVNQLYIIPDGKLGYIAFESLLTALPTSEEPNYSIHHLDYLIEDWMISYAYSSTLLMENTRTAQQKRGLTAYGGFAPVFDQSSDLIASERSCEDGNPLGALANSEKSVRELQALLGGRFFLRDEASKEQFLQQAGRYRILHLSTHACVDDLDPLFNRIFFANDFLPTYEVYNMELNADLVVLSACETGFGELVEGEGIMSLARSFMYAGSPSVVTSLWNANDYSTTQIMIDFHKNLKSGLSKDQALHQAKLQYLSQASARQSAPYLWSNFILIGNPAPVSLSSFHYWWVLLIGAFTIVGVYFWQRRNKR